MVAPALKNFHQQSHTKIAALTNLVRDRPHGTARALIVAVALVTGWYTWGHWGDIQMDCGRELYIPSEILRGKLLYRDLWYPYGPLEPYAAASLIAVFGKHFYVLYLFGLALTIGSALVLFEIGTMLDGNAIGTAAGVGLLLQGFGPSIFNYVFPWSYAGSLGMLLSMIYAWQLIKYIHLRSGGHLVAAGTFAGLALLCKQEFGAACYISLAFALSWDAWAQQSPRTLLKGVLASAPGFALAVALYGWFFWTLTPRFMVSQNWIGLPGTYFAQHGAPELYGSNGFRFVPKELVGLALGSAVALFVWWLIARTMRQMAVSRFAIALFLTAVVLAATRLLAPGVTSVFALTLTFPVGMFFIGCAFVAYALYELSKYSRDRRWLAITAFGIFALASAFRVFAEILPAGYSIFYDGPLFLIFLMVFKRVVGKAGSTRGDHDRILITSMLAAEVLLLAVVLFPGASSRTAKLETSWGTIYLQPDDARVAGQILEFVTNQKLRGHLVALLPELPIIYALTGTEAPSRWFTIIPGALSPSMEDDYIADVRLLNPEYIILTDRYTANYGAAYFGLDYDPKIYQWMTTDYAVVGKFGKFRRDGGRRLAAVLYQRREHTADSAVRGPERP